MSRVGLESGIFSMFSRLGGQSVVIYREDCSAGYDRATGKRIRSNKIDIQSCAIIKPASESSIIQDSGGERGSSTMVIQTPPEVPIYTTDERDAAGADIVFARGKFWKIMKVTDHCYYWEGEMMLLPDNICKDLGIE